MPTTAVGLVLFVVLLAPGLTFIAYRTASAPIQKLTALREIGGIVLRSVVCDIAALALFGFIRLAVPHHTPDIGSLARLPSNYLHNELAYVFWWFVLVLGAACAIAATAAQVADSRWLRGLVVAGPLTWFSPRSAVSPDPAWWVLFNQHPDKDVYAGAILDDGTYLGGRVLSYSPDSDETADRELTLSAPISFRSSTAERASELDVGAVALSARRIQYLTVSYLDPAAPA